MKAVDRGVIETISPHDSMFHPDDPHHYFSVGESAMKSIRLAVELSGVRPDHILDLPSGHGRVLRWLVEEYPDAKITACDIDRDAVDFCAEHFGAVPLYSEVEPEAIPLDRYNLIWVGSLLTHLDAPLWSRFLSVLSKRTGVLVFTTAGRYVGEDAPAKKSAWMLSHSWTPTSQRGSAIWTTARCRAMALRVRSRLGSWTCSSAFSLRVLHFAEGAWAAQQDVYVCRRG